MSQLQPGWRPTWSVEPALAFARTRQGGERLASSRVTPGSTQAHAADKASQGVSASKDEPWDFSPAGKNVRTISYMPGSNLAMVRASCRNGREPEPCLIA